MTKNQKLFRVYDNDIIEIKFDGPKQKITFINETTNEIACIESIQSSNYVLAGTLGFATNQSLTLLP